MKVLFEKSDLLEALALAVTSASSKNTLSAIEGVLIETNGKEGCIFSAYDMEKGVRTKVPANVLSEGKCIINAHKLLAIVRLVSEGSVCISVDEKWKATITSGRSNFELNALNGSDFPAMPELAGERGFSISEETLKKFIRKTLFAIAQNDQRPVFNGAYFKIEGKKITVVACDGNRLSLCKKECDLENGNNDGSALDLSFIIPGKTLIELNKMIQNREDLLRIRLTRKHVMFFIGEDTVFFSRLIDAEYIDYQRIIPTSHAIHTQMDAELMRDALERASIVTEDRIAGTARSYVKLSFEGSSLNVSSISVAGSVSDEIPISHEGDDIVIGFNCRFLLEAMRACDEERINISLSTPLMGISVSGADEDQDIDYLFFIMPIRMN